MTSAESWRTPLKWEWNTKPEFFAYNVSIKLGQKQRREAILGSMGGTTHHDAVVMRLARSVRQLIWVDSELCLYAPLAVRMWAYAQISAMEMSTENLPNIRKRSTCTCFRYWESATNNTSIGRPISTHLPI
jgi:hypothetical protein